MKDALPIGSPSLESISMAEAIIPLAESKLIISQR
tara:strand:- start:73 stop:177 length:105 start_codon:yes stop_codon:yes gene_type:complete